MFLARTTKAALARGASVFSTGRQPVAKTLSYFSLIFLSNRRVVSYRKFCISCLASRTNLIEGGVPAGMRIPPGEAGCRTKSSRIRTITRHGNSKTNPRGIEIEELPFNRILRLKKANLDRLRPFSRDESSRGRLGVEGSHFVTR